MKTKLNVLALHLHKNIYAQNLMINPYIAANHNKQCHYKIAELRCNAIFAY